MVSDDAERYLEGYRRPAATSEQNCSQGWDTPRRRPVRSTTSTTSGAWGFWKPCAAFTPALEW